MPEIWRPYHPDSDRERIVDLLIASHRASLADSEFRPTELLRSLERPDLDIQNTTRVLMDDAGTMLAFGVLWRNRILGMLVRPERHRRAEPTLIEWAELSVPTGPGVLTRDDNRFLVDYLQSRGYTPGFRELRMVRNLHDDIPTPVVPAGYAIGHVTGPADLPAWVTLYNDAFGQTSIPGPTTLDRWLSRMNEPDYDPALNIVVFDSAGQIVSMCHCSVDSIEVERLAPAQGRTEPIATHAHHRRKGLARAAMLVGMNALRERGIDEALLTTDSENTSAHRLYSSLGYRMAYQAIWFDRTG